MRRMNLQNHTLPPWGKSRVIAKRQYSDSGIILKSKSPIFE